MSRASVKEEDPLLVQVALTTRQKRSAAVPPGPTGPQSLDSFPHEVWGASPPTEDMS